MQVAVSPKDQFICTGGDDQKVVSLWSADIGCSQMLNLDVCRLIFMHSMHTYNLFLDFSGAAMFTKVIYK